LKQHSWKGNIRELRNIIERSIILSDNEELKVESLPSEFQISNISITAQSNTSAFELASAENSHPKVLNYIMEIRRKAQNYSELH
jgi:DNA-binding NtrC family response regulator